MTEKNRSGIALTTAILIMAVLGILIPVFILMIQKESRDNVTDAKKTKSLHLAEAGQDRGAWKLRESDTIWNNAMSGVVIPDYDGTKEFNDVDGGVYKIQFAAGPALGDVTVISKGKAEGGEEVRAIKAIYNRGFVTGAMSVQGGLDYKPNLIIHWGPVVTYTSIDQAPLKFFPRKYSAGQIVGRDVVNDADNGAMPSENWVTYDYAAFYDLGSPPSINLSQYRELAKQSSAPLLRKGVGMGAAAQAAGETGSGHYTGDVKIEPAVGAANYVFSSATSVIFVEGNVNRFPSGAWLDVRALIVMGNSDFNGGGTAYNATLPNQASKEYQHSSLGGYFASQGWVDGGNWTVPDCGFHGFFYIGGNMTNAGGLATLAGSVYVKGQTLVNAVSVYYDQEVGSNILISNAKVSRISWDDIVSTW